MTSSFAPQSVSVLLDYTHPEGPHVTHVRGLLLTNAIDNFKRWGVYEAYMSALSDEGRTWLVSTLATSWVPIEAAVAHYRKTSTLGISDSSLEQAGERMAVRIAEMYLANGLKRGGGIEAFASVLGRNDRMWERMYKGGACRVLRSGPAELLLEDYGNPLHERHSFRHAYVAYMEALANLYHRGVEVRTLPPSRPSPGALATRFTWRN